MGITQTKKQLLNRDSCFLLSNVCNYTIYGYYLNQLIYNYHLNRFSKIVENEKIVPEKMIAI